MTHELLIGKTWHPATLGVYLGRFPERIVNVVIWQNDKGETVVANVGDFPASAIREVTP